MTAAAPRRQTPSKNEGPNRWRPCLATAVRAIAGTAGMRDPYTAGHQHRTALLAAAIARRLARPDAEIRLIYHAGMLHDVGKISIPNEILSKPGALSTLEFQLMQGHAGASYEIAKSAEFPAQMSEIVWQHHERLDGSGYPQGLRGDEIRFGAKIIGVADVAESMTSHRPYRAALGVGAAMAELEKNKGRLYDPRAVDACSELLRGGYWLYERGWRPPTGQPQGAGRLA